MSLSTLSPACNQSDGRMGDVVDSSAVPYIETPTFSGRDEGWIFTARTGSSISNIGDLGEGVQDDHNDEGVEEQRPWRLGEPYCRRNQAGGSRSHPSPAPVVVHPPSGIMPTNLDHPYGRYQISQQPGHVGHSAAVRPPTNGQVGGDPRLLCVRPTTQMYWRPNQRTMYQSQPVQMRFPNAQWNSPGTSQEGWRIGPRSSPSSHRGAVHPQSSASGYGLGPLYPGQQQMRSSHGSGYAPYLPPPTAQRAAHILTGQYTHGERIRGIAESRLLWSRLDREVPGGPYNPEQGFAADVAKYARYGGIFAYRIITDRSYGVGILGVGKKNTSAQWWNGG